MIRLTPILLSAALAGCTAPVALSGLSDPTPAPVAAPPAVPAQVAPFLPPGAPPSVVFQDGQGCYLYSIEVTNPPSGFPVRDAAGNQVCEGRPVAIAVPSTTAAPSASAAGTAVSQPPPAGAIVPLSSGATAGGITGGSNLIDGVPITQIPPPAPLAVPLPTPAG